MTEERAVLVKGPVEGSSPSGEADQEVSDNADNEEGDVLGVERFIRNDFRVVRVVSLESLKVKK
jgi:hypothetical protein